MRIGKATVAKVHVSHLAVNSLPPVHTRTRVLVRTGARTPVHPGVPAYGRKGVCPCARAPAPPYVRRAVRVRGRAPVHANAWPSARPCRCATARPRGRARSRVDEGPHAPARVRMHLLPNARAHDTTAEQAQRHSPARTGGEQTIAEKQRAREPRFFGIRPSESVPLFALEDEPRSKTLGCP